MPFLLAEILNFQGSTHLIGVGSLSSLYEKSWYNVGTALKEDLIMAKHYDKQFKLDAIQYYHEHRELGLQGCASNLGISHQTLSRWQKELRDTGDIESRGSGNYASDEAKEIARLKRELRDAQDALDVLKKAINILGK